MDHDERQREARSPAWPDGPTLLARHAALERGEFDMAAHRTRYTRQHSEAVPGMRIITEKFQRRPDQLVQKLTVIDGTVLALNGYDGSIAWEVRDGVARILTGSEADTLKAAADFYHGLLAAPIVEAVAPKMVTVAELGAGDAGVYALTMPGASLAEAEAGGLAIIYVSKSTGLLASMSLGGGKMPWFIRQTFARYRDFGGLLVATEFSVTNRTGAVEFKHGVTIDDVRWDCVTDDEMEVPAPVQSLLKS
jgi:hypothetical protein